LRVSYNLASKVLFVLGKVHVMERKIEMVIYMVN